MRIMHILNHVKNSGNGIVNVAVDLACLQAKASHHVCIVSSGGDYQTLLHEYGVQHLTLNQSRSPINIIRATLEFSKIIKKFKPDIIHAHMVTGVILAYLFRNAGEYFLVSTVHNEFQQSSIFMGLASQVIAVSDAVSQSMVNRGIKPKKISVIRNGTLGSPRTCAMSAYSACDLYYPAIVTVCGMYERKGIAELINSFELVAKKFPKAHLYLVGDGPDRLKFEQQANTKIAKDRIHFEGFQPRPQEYLIAADIFVLASHRDPCPLVLAEAREAGCSIVATQIDGIPELLEGGRSGILVPVQDINELASAITRLLENPSLSAQFQSQALQNLGWLSANRVHEETLNLYKSIALNNSH